MKHFMIRLQELLIWLSMKMEHSFTYKGSDQVIKFYINGNEVLRVSVYLLLETMAMFIEYIIWSVHFD